MTTSLRRPLAPRQADPTWSSKLASPSALSLRQAATITSVKRPRSPDANDLNSTKRPRSSLSQSLTFGAVPPPPQPGDLDVQPATPNAAAIRDAKERKDKARQREERERAHREFFSRYTKAFPSFVFYFDDRDGSRQHAESRVLALGGTIEHFFSASVTHVITNCVQPPKNEQGDSNKENAPPRHMATKGSVLRSPIQLKGRAQDHGSYDKLVRDAVQLHKKIWNVAKLENILSRLLPNGPSSKAKNSQRSTQLNELLHHERVHGTTSERDPRERRHDYQYFPKQSNFFLVEDIRGELAPIAIAEYPIPTRTTDRDNWPAYPVLYLDPRARSPFIKYDEKEEKRQAHAEMRERVKDVEREKLRAKVKRQLKRQHDESLAKTKGLRRCASMSNLARHGVRSDLDADESGSAAAEFSNSNSFALAGDTTVQVASGFGQSAGQSTGNGYLAASGNSVPITSTATTSFVRGSGLRLGLTQDLRKQMQRHVVTNRRFEGAIGKENENPYMPRLRKAKSTTTMRLPTREENKKPGYCEACHTKFDDFKDHIHGARHRKFALNENNYLDLDFLLSRLERKLEDDQCEVVSPQVEDKAEEGSDGYLGPGDYFYVPKRGDEDWGLEENADTIPQIVIEDDNMR